MNETVPNSLSTVCVNAISMSMFEHTVHRHLIRAGYT